MMVYESRNNFYKCDRIFFSHSVCKTTDGVKIDVSIICDEKEKLISL